MYERRKRKKKALQLDKALLVTEVLSIVEQDQIEAQVMDEILRPKKRLLTCSSCRQ